MAGATTVREIFTRWGFKADTKAVEDFGRKVDSAKRMVKIATGAIVAMGAAATGITVAFAKVGDDIAKTSRALGIAADEYQRFVYAARRGGASEQEAVVGIRTLSRAINEAAQGVAEYKDNFDLLGVSVLDANGQIRPTIDISMDIAEAFAGMESGAQKTALAQELFGRSGYKMITVLEGGRAGLRAVMNQADRTGGVISDRLLKSSEKWQDMMLDVTMFTRGFGAELVEVLMPALSELIVNTLGWFDANRQVLGQKIKEWAEKGVAVFSKLADWISKAADAVGSAVEWLGGFDEAIGKAKAAVKALVAIELAKWIYAGAVAAEAFITMMLVKGKLALVVNPWMLLAAAVAALIVYWPEVQSAAIRAINGMAKGLNWLADIAASAVEALINPWIDAINEITRATNRLGWTDIDRIVKVEFDIPDLPELPDETKRMTEEERDAYLGVGKPGALGVPGAPAAPAAPAGGKRLRYSKDDVREFMRAATGSAGPTLSAVELARLGSRNQLSPSTVTVNSNLTIEVPFGTTTEQADKIAKFVGPVVKKELEAAARIAQAAQETL